MGLHSNGAFMPVSGDFSPSHVHADEECKQLGAVVDEECNSENHQTVAVPNAIISARRIALRFGALVLIVAFVGATIKSRHSYTIKDTSDQNAYEQKVIANVPSVRAPACAPFLGALHPETQKCCHSNCGQYCGSPDCKLGPMGIHGCCVDYIVDLCGSVPMAPCILPKKLRGVVDMMVDVPSAISGNPSAGVAVKDAIAKTFKVNTDDIDVNGAVHGVGRRLSLGNAFVAYEIRLFPADPINAASLQSKSEALKLELMRSFKKNNVAVNLLSVQLPLPMEVAVGDISRQIITPPPPVDVNNTNTAPPPAVDVNTNTTVAK